MVKIVPIDVKDFKEKIECIVRSIEDNSKVGGEIRGGTVQDLATEFIRQYKMLRPYKKEWHLKQVKYMPMRKPNSSNPTNKNKASLQEGVDNLLSQKGEFKRSPNYPTNKNEQK